jgi:hypothetical protein
MGVLPDGTNTRMLLRDVALLVLKLLFFRPKDLDDCSRMVALQGDRLDIDYARRQLAAHVGEADLRMEALAEMLTAVDW